MPKTHGSVVVDLAEQYAAAYAEMCQADKALQEAKERAESTRINFKAAELKLKEQL